jgi:hypothetical protein
MMMMTIGQMTIGRRRGRYASDERAPNGALGKDNGTKGRLN